MQKQITDQTAHFLTAILIVLLANFPIGMAIAGFLVGFVREQGQHWVKDKATAWHFWNWGRGSWIDITFWTFGGLVAGLLIV